MALFADALDLVNPSDWAGLDLRVMLTRSTGTAPNLSATNVAAVLAGGTVELSDTNYARKTLAGVAVVDSGSDRRCDADSLVWTALGGAQSVSGAIVYLHHATGDSTRIPLVWVPKSPAVATTGGDFTLAWATAGIVEFEDVT